MDYMAEISSALPYPVNPVSNLFTRSEPDIQTQWRLINNLISITFPYSTLSTAFLLIYPTTGPILAYDITELSSY